MKVVLLHGFPLDERMWKRQLLVLDGFEVVTPNLYRLGGNSIDGWAATILERIEGDFIAVGASMGGYCALALARRAPERVAGLLLVGSRAGADSPERRRAREETLRLLREEGLEGFADRSPVEPGPGTRSGDLVAATEALRDRPDASDVVASFIGPLLLVVGDRDDLLSVDEARAIVASAPNGRLEVVEGAGHFVSIDETDRFNAILQEFVARWR